MAVLSRMIVVGAAVPALGYDTQMQDGPQSCYRKLKGGSLNPKQPDIDVPEKEKDSDDCSYFLVTQKLKNIDVKGTKHKLLKGMPVQRINNEYYAEYTFEYAKFGYCVMHAHDPPIRLASYTNRGSNFSISNRVLKKFCCGTHLQMLLKRLQKEAKKWLWQDKVEAHLSELNMESKIKECVKQIKALQKQKATGHWTRGDEFDLNSLLEMEMEMQELKATHGEDRLQQLLIEYGTWEVMKVSKARKFVQQYRLEYLNDPIFGELDRSFNDFYKEIESFYQAELVTKEQWKMLYASAFANEYLESLDKKSFEGFQNWLSEKGENKLFGWDGLKGVYDAERDMSKENNP